MISVFAESENLAAGSAVIVALDKRRAEQARPRVVLASWSPAPPDSYRLEVLSPEAGEAALIGGRWTRKFSVALLADNQFTAAPEQIRVILRLTSGSGTLSDNQVIIKEGESQSDEFRVESVTGGSIELMARAMRTLDFSAESAAYSFAFPTRKLAKRLAVEPMPRSAPANGLDEIAVDVRIVDEANNAISAADEGLTRREVVLSFDGETRGLRVGGERRLVLPDDVAVARITLCASRPIGGVAVVASSTNRLGESLSGKGEEVSFYFPWVALLGAIAGGLTLSAFWSFRPRRLAQGVVIAGVFFGLVLFGALAAHQFEWEGVGVVNVVRLPSDNVYAAYILGFIGNIAALPWLRKEKLLPRSRGRQLGRSTAAG